MVDKESKCLGNNVIEKQSDQEGGGKGARENPFLEKDKN